MAHTLGRRYVHRLIYSDLEHEPDVPDSAADSGADGDVHERNGGAVAMPRLRMKLVEMAHPSSQLLNRSGERPPLPTPARLSELTQEVTEEEEDELVHRKLEGLAYK